MSLLTASGEEHGLINQLPNSVKTENLEHMTPELRADVQKKIKDACKIVRARYINRRNPDARFTKPYCAGGGKPIQIWKLISDHVYDLPKGFIEELNAEKGVVTRGERIEEGKMVMKDVMRREHELVPCW
jgi:hypothetical protein